MTTSKTQFVYLQRPDNGEWVTVGRFQTGPAAGTGRFKYAPNYVGAGLAWSIDPVNLPLRPEDEQPAPRYNGLHDVLRGACPAASARNRRLRRGGALARSRVAGGAALAYAAQRHFASACRPRRGSLPTRRSIVHEIRGRRSAAGQMRWG
ncbi:hypothetical protein GCM10008020_11490 [Massilia psychrophila]|nr:hypothetical protein GCM10008020_11490 [Massilia psychrophila]